MSSVIVPGVREVPIPTYVDMMDPTLRALQELGGSGTRDEVDEAVLRRMAITEEQLAVEFGPHQRQTGSKVIHRLAWARTYLKKCGAVDNSVRGVWTLLPPAQDYLSMPPQDAAKALRTADAAVRAQDRRDRLARHASGFIVNAAGLVAESSDEEEDATESELQTEPTDWRALLLARLKAMDPSAFERLAQRLLREAGFRNVEVLGRSGDGGLDGVGVYRVSLVSFTVYFQCKRHKDTVGAPDVRNFRGALAGRGEKGLLITTGVFTRDAREEATRDGVPPVELIDGEELCNLLKTYSMGVRTELVEAVVIDGDYLLNV